MYCIIIMSSLAACMFWDDGSTVLEDDINADIYFHSLGIGSRSTDNELDTRPWSMYKKQWNWFLFRDHCKGSFTYAVVFTDCLITHSDNAVFCLLTTNLKRCKAKEFVKNKPFQWGQEGRPSVAQIENWRKRTFLNPPKLYNILEVTMRVGPTARGNSKQMSASWNLALTACYNH